MAAYEMYNYPPVVPLRRPAFRRHIELIVITNRAYTRATKATDVDNESVEDRASWYEAPLMIAMVYHRIGYFPVYQRC